MRISQTHDVDELRKGIADDLAQIASPLLTRLATVDELLADRLADLKVLREARGEITKTLRPLIGEDAIPLEPGRNAKAGPKPGGSNGRPPKRGPGAYETTSVAESTIGTLYSFMRKHYAGGVEFTATTLLRDYRSAGNSVSENTVRAAFARLRDREQIRLKRAGTGRLGYLRPGGVVMAHLTMYDVRDLDLMMKLRDEQNDDGELTAQDLADALGLSDDVRAVAMRLAWMRRYGMLTFNDERRAWSLSAGGNRVIASKLKSAQADRIEALDDGQMVDVMAHVTTRYRYGDPMIATLLRREFAYGTSPLRAQTNGRGRRRR